MYQKKLKIKVKKLQSPSKLSLWYKITFDNCLLNSLFGIDKIVHVKSVINIAFGNNKKSALKFH